MKSKNEKKKKNKTKQKQKEVVSTFCNFFPSICNFPPFLFRFPFFLPRLETQGIIGAIDSEPVMETKSLWLVEEIDLNLLHFFNCCEFWSEYDLQMC